MENRTAMQGLRRYRVGLLTGQASHQMARSTLDGNRVNLLETRFPRRMETRKLSLTPQGESA